jgi:hypothetical protein
MNSDIFTSVVRTVVPVVVGLLLTLAAKAGLDFDDGAVTHIVTVAVTGVYYGVVRWAETNFGGQIGWLLGFAKKPTYES